MGLVLQRALSIGGLCAGQYHVMGDGSVVVSCPKCTGIDILDQEFKISPAGVVVSYWTCPTAGCGQNHWITLESWLP